MNVEGAEIVDFWKIFTVNCNITAHLAKNIGDMKHLKKFFPHEKMAKFLSKRTLELACAGALPGTPLLGRWIQRFSDSAGWLLLTQGMIWNQNMGVSLVKKWPKFKIRFQHCECGRSGNRRFSKNFHGELHHHISSCQKHWWYETLQKIFSSWKNGQIPIQKDTRVGLRWSTIRHSPFGVLDSEVFR